MNYEKPQTCLQIRTDPFSLASLASIVSSCAMRENIRMVKFA